MLVKSLFFLCFVLLVRCHVKTIESDFWLRNNTIVQWDLTNNLCYKQTVYVALVPTEILEIKWSVEWFFNFNAPVARKLRLKGVENPKYNESFGGVENVGVSMPCTAAMVLVVVEGDDPTPELKFLPGSNVYSPTQNVMIYDFGLYPGHNIVEQTIRRSDWQRQYDESFPVLNARDKLVFHVAHNCGYFLGPVGWGLISILEQPSLVIDHHGHY